MILKQNVLFSLTFTVLFESCYSDFLDDIEDFDLSDLAKAFSPTCKFTCKNGAKPRLNPLHKPSSNGCGSFGLKVEMGDDLPDMTPCCDKHDVCYDTCNRGKENCDDDFHTCLKQLCEKHYIKHRTKKIQDCKKAAMMMYSSTTALGCTSYLTAQESACACNAPKNAGHQEGRRRAGTNNEL